MRKYIFIIVLLIFQLSFSQVGIGTTNVNGNFIIDGGKDNSATATSTQTLNDFFVNTSSTTVSAGAGNVGIGNDTPNAKLEITAGTTNTSGLRFTNLTASSPISTSAGNPLGVDGNGNIITVSGIVASALTSIDGNFVDYANVPTNTIIIPASYGPSSSYVILPQTSTTVTIPSGGKITFINFVISISYIGGSGITYYNAQLYIDGQPSGISQTIQTPVNTAGGQFCLTSFRNLSAGNHTFDVRMSINNASTNSTIAPIAVYHNISYIN